MDIKAVLNAQRKFFNSGATLSLDFRLEQLKKLQQVIEDHESEIYEALKQDLNRDETSAFFGDIAIPLLNFKKTLKGLKKWMTPKKVHTPFPLFWPGRSEIHYEPYGVALIISPWNYPFQLSFGPLIAAIAAGNCVILKPSEVSAHSEKLLVRLINENFPAEFIHVVTGGPAETQKLLEEHFDYILYTGNTRGGKIVMTAAAKHLTPVTLELGGKSPCIVDESADLDYSAQRIALGKFFNAGQTCIAPDYIYVHKDRKEELLKRIEKITNEFYGQDPARSPSYGKIISKNQFERLSKLLQNGRVIFGGQTDPQKNYIAPTAIDQISWDDPIMKEEIFGPVLPILTFDHLDEVVKAIKNYDKPLALYYFSKDDQKTNQILLETSFGGGCVNDCIMHVANPDMPFGGVGPSGIGSYGGEFGFKTFSHAKSIYKKTWLHYPSFVYPPYSEKSLKMLKKLVKITF
ncbi:MAG: aldehyde dehydrogenase [Verrucomicrobia bacterium]|nr:aldehyde dehydrogenase [Verrucomicrobiota bacterium]